MKVKIEPLPEWTPPKYAPEMLPGELKKLTYEGYLSSPQWFAKREEAFKEHGRYCQCCGETSALQVHHLSYLNLGHEPMTDLMPLCEPCHAAITQQWKSYLSIWQGNRKPKLRDYTARQVRDAYPRALRGIPVLERGVRCNHYSFRRHQSNEDLRDEALETVCSSCGAEPEDWCRTKTGNDASELHSARFPGAKPLHPRPTSRPGDEPE